MTTAVLIRWLIFLHILSALAFFMAHGTSAAMAFKIRKETDFARMRAMLDLSLSTMIIMAVSFLIMGLTGLILPFLIHIWNKGYIWASIVLMLFVSIWLYSMRQAINNCVVWLGCHIDRGQRNCPLNRPPVRRRWPRCSTRPA